MLWELSVSFTKARWVGVLVLALALHLPKCCALVVTSPENVAGTYFASPEMIWLPNPQPAFGASLKMYGVDPNITWPGNALFVPREYDDLTPLPYSYDIIFQEFIKYNVSAFIFCNNLLPHAGGGELIYDLDDRSHFGNMLIVELGVEDCPAFTSIAFQNPNLTVDIALGDYNEWRNIRQGPLSIVTSVVLSVWTGGVASLALAKLIGFVRKMSLEVSVPQVLLLNDFATNLVRCVIWGIDFPYFGRYFNGWQSHMLATITYPSGLFSTLLIALYWLQTLKSSRVTVPKFLEHLRTPFVIISLCIMGVELGASLSRALHVANLGVMIMVAVVFYLVAEVGLGIFFFVVAAKVLAQLRAGERLGKSTSRTKALVRKTTILMIFMTFFNLMFIAAMIINLTSVGYVAQAFYATIILMAVAQTGASTVQVLAIRMPGGRPLSSSPTDGSAEKTTPRPFDPSTSSQITIHPSMRVEVHSIADCNDIRATSDEESSSV